MFLDLSVFEKALNSLKAAITVYEENPSNDPMGPELWVCS